MAGFRYLRMCKRCEQVKPANSRYSRICTDCVENQNTPEYYKERADKIAKSKRESVVMSLGRVFCGCGKDTSKTHFDRFGVCEECR